LLEDAVLSTWSQIIARLARNSDPSGLGAVFELAMAASLRSQKPAVLLQEAEDLSYLHPASIHGPDQQVTRKAATTPVSAFRDA
jgi:hypothetical protein